MHALYCLGRRSRAYAVCTSGPAASANAANTRTTENPLMDSGFDLPAIPHQTSASSVCRKSGGGGGDSSVRYGACWEYPRLAEVDGPRTDGRTDGRGGGGGTECFRSFLGGVFPRAACFTDLNKAQSLGKRSRSPLTVPNVSPGAARRTVLPLPSGIAWGGSLSSSDRPEGICILSPTCLAGRFCL